MTPEGRVKVAVKKILDAYHVFYFMPVQTGYGQQGIHDIIVCVSGKLLTVECKATSEDPPTSLQKRFGNAVLAAGGQAVLIHADNLDLLETYLHMMGAVPK